MNRLLYLAPLAVVAPLALAGCPHKDHGNEPTPDQRHDAGVAVAPAADGGGNGGDLPVLPPAPPLPTVPLGLPALPDTPALAHVTPEAVALGELAFYDPRLSADGKRACAGCHDPSRDYAGGIDTAADGKPNLRRTPTLVNLAWATSYDWDGRYASLDDLLPAHAKGQLGDDLAAAAAKLATIPVYRAHLARVGGAPADALRTALEAFALTRYSGNSDWDRRERDARVPRAGSAASDDVTAGYLLFTGKAQCAVCHTPPLYTDHSFHRIGKVTAGGDEGHGRVDPTANGAFATPSVRGAANRGSLFHAGDVTSVARAIDWYDSVGRGGAHDPAQLDPAIWTIALTADEKAQLAAFVRALAPTGVAKPPTLPATPAP